MFNTVDGPVTDRHHQKLSTGATDAPDTHTNDNPISIKNFTTRSRAANADMSTISIEDEQLDAKTLGEARDSAREGYASQASKESSQQFNQLLHFSQSLHQQIERYRQ